MSTTQHAPGGRPISTRLADGESAETVFAPFNLESFTRAQFDLRTFATQLDAEQAVRRAVMNRAERPLTSHELSSIDMAVALEWNRRKPEPTDPFCPRCGGYMHDRRGVKVFVQSPDWVCRITSCKGAIFPKASA